MKPISIAARWVYFGLREPVSALTHMLAAILAICGFMKLINMAVDTGSVFYVTTYAIYGVSLISLFLTSALYHSLNHSKDIIALLLQYDKAMVFILIIGTYAPICLVMLGGIWGWTLFGMNVVLCMFGIYLTMMYKHQTPQVKFFCQALYIISGWLIFVGWAPLIQNVDNQVTFLIFFGGVVYTIGAVIMENKSIVLIPKHVESHEIWHIIVMVGSYCHFHACMIFLR